MNQSSPAGLHIVLAVLGILFAGAAVAQQQSSVTVSTVEELLTAVSAANSAGGHRRIQVTDGTYTLPDTLYINAPHISIAGLSGDRERVVIQGDAMSEFAQVGNIVRVAASHFLLEHVTLQRAGWHAIQIIGQSNADYPVIRDCILRDTFEQLLKVTVDLDDLSVTSDHGLVENCIFEYSAGIGPQWYIGGVNAHGSKHWTVRGNTFRSIISPSQQVAQFAVHFWTDSAHNLVENNLIIDCDRGIGFGLTGRPNTGGIIRNNMIFHSGEEGMFKDAGISLSESPGSKIYNNSIFLDHDFPWAIDYRYSSTSNVLIANNLTNKETVAREGASATLSHNETGAQREWFVDALAGNLRLASAVAAVVDQGMWIEGLTSDFDGNFRPQGAGIDIGANEYSANVLPMPPTDVRVTR